MRYTWHWSVPANLLLLGEYAITRTGGLGVAVAVEPRAHAYLEAPEIGDAEVRAFRAALSADISRPARTWDSMRQLLRIEGTSAGAVERVWPESDSDETASALVAAALEAVASFLLVRAIIWRLPGSEIDQPPQPDGDQPRWRLHVDTSSFFVGSRKLGLGSSAAATLLITGALMQLAGLAPERSRIDLGLVSIVAHRSAHNGRGSGYDLACSAFGGAIAFSGGPFPAWHGIPLGDGWHTAELQLHSWATARPVRSAGAVARYETFCPPQEDASRRFLDENNRLVRRMVSARGWHDWFGLISDARRLGERLGEHIGVPATLAIGASHRDDGWVVKASGAGNERAILLARGDHRRPLPTESRPVLIAERGYSLEEGPVRTETPT